MCPSQSRPRACGSPRLTPLGPQAARLNPSLPGSPAWPPSRYQAIPLDSGLSPACRAWVSLALVLLPGQRSQWATPELQVWDPRLAPSGSLRKLPSLPGPQTHQVPCSDIGSPALPPTVTGMKMTMTVTTFVLLLCQCCPRPSCGRDAPPSVVGPRTWQVMSWRRRAKLEFPQTNCRNRVAWATWKSEPWIFPSTASTSWSS
ncbi:hypothetical protein R6Z07F_011713 [Ovis aries]